nr:MAG: hypothetical protein [Bacteriophage sp.]
MKNNLLGAVAYLAAAFLFGTGLAIVLLAIKENTGRAHYYGGKWNKTDLIIGVSAACAGGVIRYFLIKYLT